METLLEKFRAMDGATLNSTLENDQVDEIWSFMLPWCEHVRGRVGYWDGESSDPPQQSHYGLKIYSPRKTSMAQPEAEAEQEIKSLRFKLREALKLFSVVALVDHNTWRKLLVRCGVLHIHFTIPEQFDGVFPARFLLELPFGRRSPADDIDSLMRGNFVHNVKPDDALRGDLAFFCGIEQQARNSKEYTDALTKIVDIWRSKAVLGDVPDEIEIPLRTHMGRGTARSSKGMITYMQNVLNAIRHLREETWTGAVKKNSLPRVTFVLESIGADLRLIPIRSELTALVETLARDGISCCGLAFQELLSNALSSPAKNGAARKSAGKLLSSLFGGSNSASEGRVAQVLTGPSARTLHSQSQMALGSVHLFCEPSHSWFFERVCSAAVVNQTTKDASIFLGMIETEDDPAGQTWRWQWVCYGFFSARARRLSGLKSLTLQHVQLSADDVEAIRAVMASRSPEEALLDLPQQEQQQPHDFSIKANAPMRLQPMSAGEKLGSNASFKLPREVHGVKVLGDSSGNGWVDVLVPGFGKCQTRCSSLAQVDEMPVDPAGLSSLAIFFAEDPDDEVLCRFLQVVGGSLQFLTLHVATFNTSMLERITVNCPQLREVAICTPKIEVRFQVRDIKLQQQISVHPLAPASFEDIENLLLFFCVAKAPLAEAVRRLRVRIRRNEDRTATPPIQEACLTLLTMLQRNRKVEYLDVVAPDFDLSFALLFKQFHLEALPAVKDELPLHCKLGFLSVMSTRGHHDRNSRGAKRTRSSRCLVELDRNTVDLIFTFAATPVVRKTYFRASSYGEWGAHFPI